MSDVNQSLPGNPHAQDAAFWSSPEDLVAAVLALAFEVRTATLVSLWAEDTGDLLPDLPGPEILLDRLGLKQWNGRQSEA